MVCLTQRPSNSAFEVVTHLFSGQWLCHDRQKDKSNHPQPCNCNTHDHWSVVAAEGKKATIWHWGGVSAGQKKDVRRTCLTYCCIDRSDGTGRFLRWFTFIVNLVDGLAAVFSASVLEVSGIYEVSVVSRFYGVCGMFRVSRISSVSRCLEFLEYQHIAFQNYTETSSNNVNTLFL